MVVEPPFESMVPIFVSQLFKFYSFVLVREGFRCFSCTKEARFCTTKVFVQSEPALVFCEVVPALRNVS